MTQGIERIPDALGYLVINDDGAVLSSGGDLENDESTADLIMNMVQTALKVSPSPDKVAMFKRLSVIWEGFMYVITVSNRRVYVSKRKHVPAEPVTV